MTLKICQGIRPVDDHTVSRKRVHTTSWWRPCNEQYTIIIAEWYKLYYIIRKRLITQYNDNNNNNSYIIITAVFITDRLYDTILHQACSLLTPYLLFNNLIIQILIFKNMFKILLRTFILISFKKCPVSSLKPFLFFKHHRFHYVNC